MKDRELQNIAKKLVSELNGMGVPCYIWHKATTGSAYIRFEDNRIGSIRLGDHSGRSKLRYKYNIRRDIKNNQTGWIKDNGIWRYYIHSTNWKQIVPVILDRAAHVKTWPESKYKYTIPKFKEKDGTNKY